MLFVPQKNVETALISVEDLRQLQNQSRHNKKYILEGAPAQHIRGACFQAFRGLKN